MSHTVKEGFPYSFSNGGTAAVPAGAKAMPIPEEPGKFWVDPRTFRPGSFERWDATYYGIRVGAENIEETNDG